MVVAGFLLLTAGGQGNAARLGRVAGIVILLGVVALTAAAIGHV